MSTRRLTAELFGRDTRVAYSDRWAGYTLVALRLAMGWIFTYAGVTKVIDPGWSAAGYLNNAIPAGNPFPGLWTTLAADYLWLIDPLNAWGLTLIGVALLAGGFVRLAAFWGGVAMAFYWASSLPLANGLLIDSHVVYALTLFALGAFGAGRLFGADRLIERTELVEQNSWLRLFLG